MATTVAFRTLDDAGKLPDNYVNPYYLEDLKRRVSIARAGGKLYAFEDLCKHEGCPLSSGLLTGTTLMCQCHGSQYDITSGAVLRGPATEPLATYEVREQSGRSRFGSEDNHEQVAKVFGMLSTGSAERKIINDNSHRGRKGSEQVFLQSG